MRRWIILLAATAAAACGQADDDRPPTLSYITATILRPSCGTGSCHSSMTGTGGRIFDNAEDAFISLQDVVVAGQPERSELIGILRGVEGVYRMPADAPLPDADIELIEAWIADGAEKN